jgi:hypothetical protein
MLHLTPTLARLLAAERGHIVLAGLLFEAPSRSRPPRSDERRRRLGLF